MKDKTLLQNISNSLSPYGLTPLVAEHYLELQATISDKIKNLILDCDIGLVLLTINGFNSGFVREEIGYLHAKEKPIVLVIESGLEQKYSGFNYGHDFILFDPLNPTATVNKITKIMLEHWQRLKADESRTKEIAKAEQAQQNKNALIAIGILAGILILGSDN